MCTVNIFMFLHYLLSILSSTVHELYALACMRILTVASDDCTHNVIE